MDIMLRFSSSLQNVTCSVLLNFGRHTKSKKIQRTVCSFGVLMDLGDEIVFLVYSYCVSYKELNNYDTIKFAYL